MAERAKAKIVGAVKVMLAALGLLLSLLIIYNLIPNLYYRNFSRRVVKNLNPQRQEIALTFDDGPDPRYLERLLGLLARYQIKATFFMVAKKAEQNRELVKMVSKAGHLIGLHSLRHQSAWLSSPTQVRDDFTSSLAIFTQIGVKIKHYRPPWGTFNLLTPFYAQKNKLKTILWSINARDWRGDVTVEEIVAKTINNIKNGDIIVLHDSNGASGAPERTLKALEVILPSLLQRGYQFTTIPE